jgi:glycosyltransferase involved in cell wall biosynthesis
MARGPRLACLLPVRNCAGDLPGYLESAGRFADAVLALDDGSTDATPAILKSSPLVRAVLHNGPRPTYAGWDDRLNRQRLLEAAVEHGCDWALYLDADERISADDAGALRTFIEEGADPDCAYCFRVFRMIGDGHHYDQCGLWVARLFPPAPGQVLPSEQLHLVPVPTAIPSERWHRTTLRIQHLSAMTKERRHARFRKYEQADPQRRWQTEYRHLLQPPGRPRPWSPRSEKAPVLADRPGNGSGAELARPGADPARPVISAIVISLNDQATIERAVRSVVEQRCSYPFEVIVVTSGHDRTAETVRRRFPAATLVELPGPALPGEARNAGLRVARGEYLTFPGSHIELPQGSLEARVRAHRRGFDMVTDTVINGTRTRAGWAAYFLDHAECLPGRPSSELAWPPGHCSYPRQALLELGGFPEGIRAGEDTVVNTELWDRGRTAYRAGEVVIVHHSPCGSVSRLARHHYQRGRAWARIGLGQRNGGSAAPKRSILLPLVRYPFRRLSNTDTRVRLWGDGLTSEYRRSRPLVLLGIASAWAGMWVELLRLRTGPRPEAATGHAPPPAIR